MRKIGCILIMTLCLALTMLPGCLGAAETAPVAPASDGAYTHGPDQRIDSADAALALLREGNLRFIAGTLSDKSNYAQERAALQEGQIPFAVVLTCSDSRVAPEIFFDQEMGDLFTIRNAGNIADGTTLGSIEYAVEHLHVPLVVVVGHSRCGAVTAAFEEGTHPADLQSILDRITPACEGAADVSDAIDNHIARMVALIRDNEIVRECGALVIGAHYGIEDGAVTWTGGLED